ncbi:MAG TPA: DUF4173 domain-containing protein [Phenylobacterium sp.]
MTARLPSFRIKATLVVWLSAAGDVLLWQATGVGANLGVFGLAIVLAVGVASPAIRRHPLALAALLAAALLAALQIERATLVGWISFTLALAVAALAPRAPSGQDGWRWAQRLLMGGLKGLSGPVLDLRDVMRARTRKAPLRVAAIAFGAILPVVGGMTFLCLFAVANPVISEALRAWRLPEPDMSRAMFWVVVAVPAWGLLRPRGLRRTIGTSGLDGELDLPGVTTASIAISLGLFNLIFALQNGLDLAFLWNGAGLPDGVTFADYAHRGAYPLIATALLAGLFVIVFLRPGSRSAADRRVRLLVIAWVAQNLFLVASTALRTIDYIDVYSLTRVRIAALIWMGLVALGLVLILWRMLRAKSTSWLINTNLLAVGLVLATCSAADLGAFAAAWNVRHLPSAARRGVELDLCYFDQLKGAGIVSLAQLEQTLPAGDPRDRVAWKRRSLSAEVARQQSEWRTWRWRDARRLARVAALTGETPVFPAGASRRCDGSAPLTPTPNPGT